MSRMGRRQQQVRGLEDFQLAVQRASCHLLSADAIEGLGAAPMALAQTAVKQGLLEAQSILVESQLNQATARVA